MFNLLDDFDTQPLCLLTGNEDLSVGERLSFFFKEFSAKVDRGLSSMGKSVHTVDVDGLKKALAKNKPSYLKNSDVYLPVPEGFKAELGSMMNHVERVSDAVFLASSLKTEAGRLYDWLKEVIIKGRIDKEFNWGVSDFDIVVDRSIKFIKSLPENRADLSLPLSKLYVNFDELVSVSYKFNTKAKLFKTRDAEITSKEVTRVYDLGMTLVKKVDYNDIILEKDQLKVISEIVNKFIELTNITGAMLVLFNEASKILSLHVDKVKSLKE